MRYAHLILPLLLLTSCIEFKTWEPAPATSNKPFWTGSPSGMRIHPGTRFVSRGVKPTLDLRVRLLDEMGDPIKASGHWVFEAKLPAVGTETSGHLIGQWSQEVLTQEQHATLFDRVSSAYRFSLPLTDNLPLGTRVIVQAVFTPMATPRKLVTAGEVLNTQ